MNDVKIIYSDTLGEVEKKFYKKIEGELSTVMDVGAYPTFFIGDDVHYFEPHPERFNLLNKTIEKGFINNFGLGANNGDMILFNGINSIYYRKGKHLAFKKIDFKPINIKLKTLDWYVNEHNIEEISLLKIDVEGAELDVLRGGIKSLNKCKYIVFEYANDTANAAGITFNDIKKLLIEHDFNIFNLDDESNLIPLQEILFEDKEWDDYFKNGHLYNLVAINKNHG